MFNLPLYVCAENFYIMNIDMLASVGAPPLDTTSIVGDDLLIYICYE